VAGSGEAVADAVGNPERDLREDLENFARRVERGDLKQGGPSDRHRAGNVF